MDSLGTVRGRLGMVLGGTPTYSGLPTKGAPPIATYWIAIIWVVAQGFSAMFDRARG